ASRSSRIPNICATDGAAARATRDNPPLGADRGGGILVLRPDVARAPPRPSTATHYAANQKRSRVSEGSDSPQGALPGRSVYAPQVLDPVDRGNDTGLRVDWLQRRGCNLARPLDHRSKRMV